MIRLRAAVTRRSEPSKLIERCSEEGARVIPRKSVQSRGGGGQAKELGNDLTTERSKNWSSSTDWTA